MKKIAICGAGIAGIATAYYLSQFIPKANIALIDKNEPLSFTSSQSGENFRDYWTHPCMEKLCNHSIDLMESLQKELDEPGFTMKFSGYHFVSNHQHQAIFADDNTLEFRNRNKVETDAHVIHQQHPYLSPSIQKSIFIKKAGYVDSMVMVNAMLQKAKNNKLQLIEDEVVNIIHTNTGIIIKLAKNKTIAVDQIIIATGPFINCLLYTSPSPRDS